MVQYSFAALSAFFPAPFQARIARKRLGKMVDEIPGGHLVALSRPREFAERLLAYSAGTDP
jgi:hypothetical protein